ncbi:hypothetical protein L3V59_10145 [Burkholderia aenigmatica]|nr:hypothetical protein [Burkholderia aenigmatica]UKD13282.1 hypothetical protein L3V59_10145 [Burkholderia aenigmatica]
MLVCSPMASAACSVNSIVMWVVMRARKDGRLDFLMGSGAGAILAG